MAKIETLKGQKITGETLLHQLLEEHGSNIDNVVTVIHFKDGSMDCFWNDIGSADLSLSSDYLKSQVLVMLMRDSFLED